MDRLAVTGAGGFIGGAVCRHALAAGYEVVAIGPGDLPFHPRLRHYAAPIRDPAVLAPALSGVRCVIHAAGRGTPATVPTLTSPAAQNELSVAEAVLAACARAGVGMVVLVSSGGTMYGDVPGPLITEAQAVAPACPYGEVKAAIERLGRTAAQAGGFRCVVARLSNPFGPGQLPWRGQGLVAAVFERFRRGEPAEIWGDGSAVRDYIYIEDAARGLLAAATRPDGALFHVSSGRGTATRDVVRDVALAAGVQARAVHRADGARGVNRNVLSSARLTAATGWTCRIGWEEGLAATAAWWAGEGYVARPPTGRARPHFDA